MGKMNALVLGLALATIGAVACAGPESAGSADPVPDELRVQSPPISPEMGAGIESSLDSVPFWALHAEGAGPLAFGMTIAELAPYLTQLPDTAAIGAECNYVEVRDAPDSLGFMVEGRQLVRIDVLGGATPTREGARVGDTEARILELYPAARRGPHKYTAGAYLVVLPDAPADSLHRLVFETDGERVTNFRAGLFPPVEYVERCG